MSLQFLNLKSWHPASKANQKRVWIAEQTARDREQREKELAAEVRKAADARHYQEVAAAHGDEAAARRAASQQVGFLYAAPPGLQTEDKPRSGKTDAGTTARRGESEDEAVRAFHRRVDKTRQARADPQSGQRNLERYVGRRREEPLTMKDQVERFPMLKDAPVEGGYTDSLKVNFQPVGLRLRNVRCIRCAQWGHQSGDRECKLRDQNPHDAARQTMEDPVTHIKKLKSSQRDLVLRKAALPLEMQTEGQTEEFDILPSEDDEPADPEKEFLASLSAKDKKRLLRKLKKQSEKESSSSSSSSDSDGDSRHRSKARRRPSKHKRRHKSKHRHKHHTKERSGTGSTDEDREHSGRHGHASSLEPREQRCHKRRHRSQSRSRSRVREHDKKSRTYSSSRHSSRDDHGRSRRQNSRDD